MSTLELVRGEEILATRFPPAVDLVASILRQRSLNFLAGEEGCGKSLLAMNLAVNIAEGQPDFLGFKILEPGKVLYLNNELAYADFGVRLQKMMACLPGKTLTNLIVPKAFPSLNDCWESLTGHCEAEKPLLVILDCLYFSHNQDENDSSSMKSIIRKLMELRDRYNLCLVVIHHTKKGTRFELLHNDQMRGAGVFGQASDSVLMLRRSSKDETRRIFKPTKLRHARDEDREARLLLLDPSLWYIDLGPVDEEEHMPFTVGRFALDFKSIFDGREEMSGREIVDSAYAKYGMKTRTTYRRISEAEGHILEKVRNGLYRFKVDIAKPLEKT